MWMVEVAVEFYILRLVSSIELARAVRAQARVRVLLANLLRCCCPRASPAHDHVATQYQATLCAPKITLHTKLFTLRTSHSSCCSLVLNISGVQWNDLRMVRFAAAMCGGQSTAVGSIVYHASGFQLQLFKPNLGNIVVWSLLGPLATERTEWLRHASSEFSHMASEALKATTCLTHFINVCETFQELCCNPSFKDDQRDVKSCKA